MSYARVALCVATGDQNGWVVYQTLFNVPIKESNGAFYNKGISEFDSVLTRY